MPDYSAYSVYGLHLAILSAAIFFLLVGYFGWLFWKEKR
jgi:hypothetical protein